MSANCICCTNPYEMGCVVSCEVVTLPILAPAPDMYTILLEYNGNIIKIERAYLLNDNITLLPGEYNEGYDHSVKVMDSNGTVITYEPTPGTEYDCVNFHAKPLMNPSASSGQETLTEPEP